MTKSKQSGHRVLIVDDEPAIRDSVKKVLRKAGHDVRTADGGGAALEALRAHATDVVITDIIMPQMHGVDVIKQLRREFPKVRIVAVSGGGNFGSLGYSPEGITTSAYLAAAKQAGAHVVLVKPFERRELLAAVDAAMAIP